MADIFISYKREDRAFAARLAQVLNEAGYEVWYDFSLLSGDRYRKVIQTIIDKCSIVLVLWSNKSVDSDFVLDEATYAKTQNKLCPVAIEPCPIPFGFGGLHTVSLEGWTGEVGHEGFKSLQASVRAKVGFNKAATDSVKTSTENAELEAFKAAALLGTRASWQELLRQYPQGKFSAFARAELGATNAVHPVEGVAHTPERPRSQGTAVFVAISLLYFASIARFYVIGPLPEPIDIAGLVFRHDNNVFAYIVQAFAVAVGLAFLAKRNFRKISGGAPLFLAAVAAAILAYGPWIILWAAIRFLEWIGVGTSASDLWFTGGSFLATYVLAAYFWFDEIDDGNEPT